MLLNTIIEIVVTNDGQNNNVSTKADLELNLNDVITSIELAKRNYVNMFTLYIKSKYSKKPNSKEIDKLIKEITLQDIFNFSQQKTV